MKRNYHKVILIAGTLLLYIGIFCLFIRHAEALETTPVYNTALTDPYRESILESRDFSDLIVSICGDEKALYDEEDGLLTARYMEQGAAAEEAIQVYVYDSDGNPLIAQGAGIRISGAASRSAMRKSFRIIARSKYDSSFPKFTYDLWGGRQTVDGSGQTISEYSSFNLHSVRRAMDATGIHNSVGYKLARKAGIIDASPTTPAALYINGIYQGAYFILPAKTDNAIAELYRISKKSDIEIVSVFEEEKTGTQTHPEVLEEYLDFAEYVQTSDVNDPEVKTEIERQLDVEQCLQYYAVNLLLANGDWLDNNLRIWRCKNNGLPYQDGKWRFFLFDLDWIGSFQELTASNFVQATTSDEYYNILPALLRNPEYLSRFKQIIQGMEQDAFNEETIRSVFETEEARMRDEVAYDFQSDAFISYQMVSANSSPTPRDEWMTMEDRERMIEDFQSHMIKAPAIIDECLQTYFP